MKVFRRSGSFSKRHFDSRNDSTKNPVSLVVLAVLWPRGPARFRRSLTVIPEMVIIVNLSSKNGQWTFTVYIYISKYAQIGRFPSTNKCTAYLCVYKKLKPVYIYILHTCFGNPTWLIGYLSPNYPHEYVVCLQNQSSKNGNSQGFPMVHHMPGTFGLGFGFGGGGPRASRCDRSLGNTVVDGWNPKAKQPPFKDGAKTHVNNGINCTILNWWVNLPDFWTINSMRVHHPILLQVSSHLKCRPSDVEMRRITARKQYPYSLVSFSFSCELLWFVTFVMEIFLR